MAFKWSGRFQTAQRYRIARFPIERRIIEDGGRLGKRVRSIHGLLDLDITETRARIRAYRRRTRQPLSLTSYIIYCFSHALVQHKQLNAYRKWRNQIVIYDDVDVTVIVETSTGDGSFPLAHIIKAANQKSFREIHDEVSDVQRRPVVAANWRFMRWFLELPVFVRMAVYGVIRKYPPIFNRYVGTTGVTSVGMFGGGGGWGIPLTVYTLNLTVGGLSKKPAVVNDEITIREFLSVTVSADHDLVDGAPLARFISTFKRSVERGYGLTDLTEDWGET